MAAYVDHGGDAFVYARLKQLRGSHIQSDLIADLSGTSFYLLSIHFDVIAHESGTGYGRHGN
jgi:hypothetical protein